ncbi:hypothetical protein JL09_g7062, partial [Pichia kudriavzevii]
TSPLSIINSCLAILF